MEGSNSPEAMPEVQQSEYSSSAGRESEQAKRMAGGQKTTEETFVDLHEHSIALGEIAKWDRAAPLLAGGTLLLGAAIGALAAGTKLVSTGVLVCGASGLAFLIGGLLLRDERIRSAQNLYESFERRLALYDDDPDVRAIRERFKRVDELTRKQTLRARLASFLRSPF